MNDCHATNEDDYNVINNITYDELICNQKPIDYSMFFFCIKENKSNQLASGIFCLLNKIFKRPQPSYKGLIYSSFNAVIFFLILLSVLIVMLVISDAVMMLALACIPVLLLIYFFVQITLDSLNSITIKVAEFKVGTSEVNKKITKIGYDKILLKQYIVNTSNNSFGLVHIQNINLTNDINGVSVRIWPLQQMTLFYNAIIRYVKRINILRTYYFKDCKIEDIHDDNDRCCIDKLNSTANSILEIYNKAIDIDRVIIFRNETPIYCKDTI